MKQPEIKVTGRVLTYSKDTIVLNPELLGGEKETANADNRFSEGVPGGPAGSNPARRKAVYQSGRLAHCGGRRFDSGPAPTGCWIA